MKHGDFISATFAELYHHPELFDSIDEPLNIFLAIGELIARYQQESRLHREHPLHTLAGLLGPVMYTSILNKALRNKPLPAFDLEQHIEYSLVEHRVDINGL